MSRPAPDTQATSDHAQHLEVIARHFPGGLYRLDTRLCVRFATTVYERWFRRPMQQIVGQPLSALMSPDEFAQASPHLLRALAGETVSYLNVMAHPDGPGHHALMVFTPEFDAQGQVCGLVSTYTDVTAVEQDRARSERWEARLRALMDALPDPIWLKDSDGVYLACNRALARRLRLSPADVVGKRDHELVSDAQAQAFKASDDDALRANAPVTTERVNPAGPDGPRGVFEITKAPVRDGHGALLGIVGIARDVTLQRAIDRELREANQNLQATLDALPDLVMELDLEGHYLMLLTPANDMLAAPENELVGRHVTQVLPPEAARACLLALQEAERDGHSRAQPYALDLPQGRRWFELTLSRKHKNPGQPSTFIGLARDITLRQQAQQALKLTLDSMAQGIAHFDAGGRLVLYNGHFQRLMGFSDEFLARCPSLLEQLRHQSELGDFPASESGPMAAFVRSGDPHDIAPTYTRRQKNGTVMQVDTCVLPDGGVVRTFSDVTDHVDAHEQLQREQQRLAQILEGTQAGTWDWDVATGDTTINDRWAEIVGYTLEDLVPLTRERFLQMMHPEDRERSLARWTAYSEGRSDRYECDMRLRHRQGHWVWVLSRGRAYAWDADGRPQRVSGTELDISELKLAEDRLRHIAQHDPLTGLPNRHLLADRLQRSLAMARREGRRLVLMFVDLDRFKPINDELGHDFGDAVLRMAADRMLGCMRESDSVARVGGDEFVVLLDRVDRTEDALAVAEKLRVGIAAPYDVAGQRLNISASIGVALFPDHGKDDTALMVSADQAMYQAKHRGGDQVWLAQIT